MGIPAFASQVCICGLNEPCYRSCPDPQGSIWLSSVLGQRSCSFSWFNERPVVTSGVMQKQAAIQGFIHSCSWDLIPSFCNQQLRETRFFIETVQQQDFFSFETSGDLLSVKTFEQTSWWVTSSLATLEYILIFQYSSSHAVPIFVERNSCRSGLRRGCSHLASTHKL